MFPLSVHGLIFSTRPVLHFVVQMVRERNFCHANENQNIMGYPRARRHAPDHRVMSGPRTADRSASRPTVAMTPSAFCSTSRA